jgi:exopolysaccharide/PEP-CTERM locus tyrosine autokinase
VGGELEEIPSSAGLPSDSSAFDAGLGMRAGKKLLTLRDTDEDQELPRPQQSKRQKAEQKRIAEEFRMVKRPLLVHAFDRRHAGDIPFNLLMVSSSVQSEGKTFVSLNLAASMTLELDCWVLLIDGDVAKPGLSRRLGIADEPGLIEHLDEGVDLADLILNTDIPKLSILPAGRRHKQSTELLASSTMRRLLHEIATRYPDRIVLCDSPPVLSTSESPVLASLMGRSWSWWNTRQPRRVWSRGRWPESDARTTFTCS